MKIMIIFSKKFQTNKLFLTYSSFEIRIIQSFLEKEKNFHKNIFFHHDLKNFTSKNTQVARWLHLARTCKIPPLARSYQVHLQEWILGFHRHIKSNRRRESIIKANSTSLFSGNKKEISNGIKPNLSKFSNSSGSGNFFYNLLS